MRQLTASQKSIVKAWVKKHFQKSRGNSWERVDFPSDPANAMLEDGTYDKLEKINDTEILYQEINRFAHDYYSDLNDRDGGA